MMILESCICVGVVMDNDQWSGVGVGGGVVDEDGRVFDGLSDRQVQWKVRRVCMFDVGVVEFEQCRVFQGWVGMRLGWMQWQYCYCIVYMEWMYIWMSCICLLVKIFSLCCIWLILKWLVVRGDFF